MAPAPSTEPPSSDTPGGNAPGSGMAPGFDGRYVWLAIAALIFALGTWLALTQDPRPDPYRPVQALSPDWWRYPVERNAFKRLPVIGGTLNAVHAHPDGRDVWAVGAAGLIVHSADGGRTWARQEWTPPGSATRGAPEPPSPPIQQQTPVQTLPPEYPKAPPTLDKKASGLPSLLIPEASAGEPPAAENALPPQEPAANAPAVEQTQAPPPAEPQVGSSGSRGGSFGSSEKAPAPSESPIALPDLQAVFFLPDARTGWAVGEDGTILHTTDAGASWVPQASGTEAWLHSVTFADSQTGWAVGNEGTILHTGDAGSSWVSQVSGTQAGLKSVVFTNARVGWAVGEEGTVLHTSDAGRSWAPQESRIQVPLLSVVFIDARRGWAVSPYGAILQTTDAGASWTPQARTLQAAFMSVAFGDTRTGWVVGSDGTTLHTTDGGATWASQASGTEAQLYSVAFAGVRTGWAVGEEGTILYTGDAGASWVPQARGTSFRTGDAGQTSPRGERPETRPSPEYARYPAPWWYLTLLAGLGGIGMALRRPRPRLRSVASVADLALSDRPLEAGDRDALEFRPIALGLSNFLRNTATEPPLTLAITGDWGSGKSSLMNLLRSDLRARGFRPVWFNAWHQPKDVNLLAALVSTIQAQALPPLPSAEGLRFRWQLAWMRTRERPVWTAAMVFLAAWLLTYFGMKPAHLTAAIEWLPHFARALTDEDAASAENLLAHFKSFAALVAVLGPVLTAWHGLQAFGVKPAALVASLAGGVKQAVARSRFLGDYARQFRDVADALRPRTLTIFIDDLDRCPPERVREALEAVNYLVSSGPCFVVLGMARERVEACVGIAFKDVAEEMVNLSRLAAGTASAVPQGPEDEARRHRRHYARDYLKKLVNIEVPVPQPNERQAKGLVGASPDAAPPASAWRELVRAAGSGWPLAMVVVVAVLGWWSGVRTPDVALPQPAPAAAVAPVGDTGKAPAAPDGTTPQHEEPGPQPSQAAFLVPGETSPVPAPAWLVPLVLLLAAAGATLARRPPVVERDSQTFRDALTNWLPLVAARQNTPREVKRFVNRVRLLAMRQRAEGGEAQLLDEPTLVALGALHHLDDSLVEAPPAPGAGIGTALAGTGHAWAARIARPLDEALDAHAKTAPWPPGPDQIELFRKLVGGVRLD